MTDPGDGADAGDAPKPADAPAPGAAPKPAAAKPSATKAAPAKPVAGKVTKAAPARTAAAAPTTGAATTPAGPQAMLGKAALAIEASLALLLVSGAITALAFDINRTNAWEARVKLLSLSEQGFTKFTGVGFGIVVPLALILALALVGLGSGDRLRAPAASGAIVIGVWFGALTALSIYVDVTEIDGADFAAATALADLATLLLLAVTVRWAYSMTGTSRR